MSLEGGDAPVYGRAASLVLSRATSAGALPGAPRAPLRLNAWLSRGPPPPRGGTATEAPARATERGGGGGGSAARARDEARATARGADVDARVARVGAAAARKGARGGLRPVQLGAPAAGDDVVWGPGAPVIPVIPAGPAYHGRRSFSDYSGGAPEALELAVAASEPDGATNQGGADYAVAVAVATSPSHGVLSAAEKEVLAARVRVRGGGVRVRRGQEHSRARAHGSCGRPRRRRRRRERRWLLWLQRGASGGGRAPPRSRGCVSRSGSHGARSRRCPS